MIEILGSLIGIVALYHLFGCGNPVSLFAPKPQSQRQGDASTQVANQTGHFMQVAQGQTAPQEEEARTQIQPVIDYLQQQGMDAAPSAQPPIQAPAVNAAQYYYPGAMYNPVSTRTTYYYAPRPSYYSQVVPGNR